MDFIKNTYISYNKEDIFVLIFNKKSVFNNEEIDGELIDKFIESDIFNKYEVKDEEIIFYLNISDDIKHSRDCFINGSFSKISNKDKYKILDFLFEYDKTEDLVIYSKVSKILRKDTIFKQKILKDLGLSHKDIPEDIELRSKINIEEETYYAT